MKRLVYLLAACAVALDCSAVETRFWQQTDAPDFEKGTLTNLSLRSDGRLYLAPEFREIYDPSTPYLWAVVSDSNGTLYAAGGGSDSGNCKLFAIDSKGAGHVAAELEGLEIHALAAGSDGAIYAATDPDGKVYKYTPGGKAELFFNPGEKYIWALAFNSRGELFVATGDQGNIYRVTRDGKGSIFFKTGETHARSLAIDRKDNIIVGTEPAGLVLRVSPQGQGFVLYQSPKREVTAIAVNGAGEIYAAAAGTHISGPTPAPPPPPPASVLPATPPGVTPNPSPRSNVGTVTSSSGSLPSTAVAGGSELYRIDTDDSPHRIWSNSQDIVYAIAFDTAGHPLLATGNRGYIYRIDSDLLNTILIEASPTQITNFTTGPGGRLFAVTGNIGRVYEIGPGTAAKGTFETEVLDAGSFTYWGRLSFRGTPASAAISTRSGNLNRPQENWSPWAPLRIETGGCSRCLSGRVQSPSARFLQVKVDLAQSGPPTPEVASLEVAYLSKNVAPAVEEIEVTPPNYRFPVPVGPPAAAAAAPTSISLPPLGQKRHSSTGINIETSSGQTLTFAKGMLGARWSAGDENGDTLVYTVEIRGAGETAWLPLKTGLHDKYISFDSAAFPDGEYELRVTASDSPSNTPAEALSSSLVTDPFLIDNTPPKILNLSARPAGGRIDVSWRAHDDRSIIDRAEYSIDGGDWTPVNPKSKLSDSPDEEYVLTVDHAGSGGQTIAVRVTDAYENQAVEKVVVGTSR